MMYINMADRKPTHVTTTPIAEGLLASIARFVCCSISTDVLFYRKYSFPSPYPLGGYWGLCRTPKLMIFIGVSREKTANHGPNAVSVVRLRGCWSTIRLRPYHFGTRKMLLSVELFRWILLYNALWAMSTTSSTFRPTPGLLDRPARVGRNVDDCSYCI